MIREQIVTYKPGDDQQTPMIRIANRFILKYGFSVGDKIEVDYGDSVITIRKEGNNN